MITVKRFSASWCQPCKVLAPEFKKFEEEYTDIKFVTVDVETDSTTAELYNIRSVPTVIIEKNGDIVERLVGLNSKKQYIEAFNRAREIT
jgi:thioredoxin 1